VRLLLPPLLLLPWQASSPWWGPGPWLLGWPSPPPLLPLLLLLGLYCLPAPVQAWMLARTQAALTGAPAAHWAGQWPQLLLLLLPLPQVGQGR
jgi:hypothetical protein